MKRLFTSQEDKVDQIEEVIYEKIIVHVCANTTQQENPRDL